MGALKNSWKTTIVAILTAVFGILKTLGIIEIPPDVMESIILVVIFILGLLSADAASKKKT